ncbi:MAG: hypothetical protein ACAI44_24125 [Candidatus Sericytochromatia bacterium]
METITIQAHQPKYQLRFQDATAAQPGSASPAPDAAAQQPEAAGSCQKGDQLCLSGRARKEKPPETLQLFDNKQKASSQQFMERLVTRQSSFSVGPELVQLEVGTESAAPQILTTSKEPDPVQELQGKIQNMGKSAGEQVFRTGAVIQPADSLQIQIGMASAVDTGKLMAPKEPGAKDENQIRPGMYAGVALRSESLSTRVAVDTAFGKPRIEVGGAMTAVEGCTVGLSYLHTEEDRQRTLRLGTEIHASRDTVLGVNVNQPLNQATQVNGNTSVGVYLNTRFN